MASQSPLKGKPLRNPGDSIDEEIRSLTEDKLLEVLFFAGGFSLIAMMEWFGYLTNAPRRPILLTCVAVVACGFAAWRGWQIRDRIKKLKLGRDGERCVGQFLERLREIGGQVFHDVPGENFNVDHVIISTHGVYAVETKTFSKPSRRATITVEGDSIRVAGRRPNRDPIEQVTAAARWLEGLLEASTGKKFSVRGVVVFPGWYVEQRTQRGSVWVLEPKALPAFIEKEPASVAPAEVALAAFHLSRYVRGEVEKAA